mmetsp:Transcript_34730/g.45919  ORF Transcript_34730/g.45919 Transcript_34730/m.45919 type:complete len:715 (+) Transcript_34730:174-2318(+)
MLLASLFFSLIYHLAPQISNAAILKVGNPMPFDAARPYLSYVREHGVQQFIETYRRVCSTHLQDAELKWGDEVEYGVFKLDPANRTVALSLRGPEIMEELNRKEKEQPDCCQGACWMPEYGRWMVESTPHKPYMGNTDNLLNVEVNMRLRRTRLKSVLRPDEVAPTITNFPLMGLPGTYPSEYQVNGPIADSDYIPDEIIHPHPRFGALTKNIRSRRGRKVDIQIPLFCDDFTPEYQDVNDEVPKATQCIWDCEAPSIKMDAMAFGMGSCCVQLTFQATNLDESRYMYDQLGVLSPILLAMTAATPIHKGRLAGTDVRWASISRAVDDRTQAEMGAVRDPKPDQDLAGSGMVRIPKSRYDSISCFIYQCKQGGDDSVIPFKYNDINCPIDERSYEALQSAGIDKALAKHVAHLFVRDPLVIFEDNILLDDTKATDHWDNIQSTNWQTVRWKPPPVKQSPEDPEIGWRVELRSMEVQLTDFENAAYVVFMVLVTRVLLAFDLNLYVPISKVDENMKRAHKIDAVLNEKFFFRKNIAPEQHMCEKHTNEDFSLCACDKDDEFVEMKIESILMGNEYFPGLIPLVYAYLDHINCPPAAKTKVSRYLSYIEKRATGELQTTAAYIRNFVQSHPEYKGDSVVTQGIAYDLLKECTEIGEGLKSCSDLLDNEIIKPLNLEDAWETPLLSSKLSAGERSKLMEYTQRSSFNERVSSQVPSI